MMSTSTSMQWGLKVGLAYMLPALLGTLKQLSSYSSKSNTFIFYYPWNRKVDPNLYGKDSWTPLEIAIQSGFFNIVDLLIKDKRIMLNSATNERGTPLHLAAKSNYLPICQILLLAGIDLTIQDSNGNLAKDVTTNLQIRNLIEKYEEQINSQPQGLIDEIKEEEDEENEQEEEEEKIESGRNKKPSPTNKKQ